MAAMIPTPFNWSRLIAEMTDESFGIPPDVTFQIEENGQLHEVKENGQLHEVKENGQLHEVKEENGELHEVKAHKMILGMVSPAFKTMFYTTNIGDKTANVIKVEKTTAPAFQIMIDAVYNIKSIEASLKGKSIHEVFDVMILVEMYQIEELMDAVKEHLTKYPITDVTVLGVAKDVKEYTNMFEAEAKQLLSNCAKFLKTKLKDINAVTRYAAENKGQGEVFAGLLALMNDMAPCPNCNKEICQDGETVRNDEFGEGLLVTNNRATGYWGNYDKGTGRVSEVEATMVKVVNIKPGVTQNGLIGGQFTSHFHYKSRQSNNGLNFLFRCN